MPNLKIQEHDKITDRRHADVDISHLQRDVLGINDTIRIFTGKLDGVIVKIAELGASLKESISLNEQKINIHLDECSKVKKLTEDHRTKITEDIEQLNQKINDVNLNLSLKFESGVSDIKGDIKVLTACLKNNKFPDVDIDPNNPPASGLKKMAQEVTRVRPLSWLISGAITGFAWGVLHINFPALSAFVHTIIIN